MANARSTRAAAGPPDEAPTVLVQRFAVPFEYPVHFTSDVLAPENPTLALAVTRLEPERRHRVLPVLDAGLAEAWPRLAEALAAYADAHPAAMVLAGPAEVLPGGEACKNDPALPGYLRARMQALAVDRHSFVMAFGGGAVLDVAGYAAATTHRGVRLVRVPTTVLAQCDGGAGVKNGVNAFGVKNFVGTFAPPFAVVNDARFLDTLPARERRAGLAEAVKVALIRDRAFFDWLGEWADALAAGEPGALGEAVRRCAELHLAHIVSAGDPFEMGNARPLDFGHWSAHKLESLTAHRLRHGEAVAIGLALDARYSADVGLLAPAALEAICDVLERLGLPLWDAALEVAGPDGRPAVLRGLDEFREHLGGDLTITLLAGLGRGVDVGTIDTERMRRALDWLRERSAR
jgi:3-dehydroquinate synthase